MVIKKYFTLRHTYINLISTEHNNTKNIILFIYVTPYYLTLLSMLFFINTVIKLYLIKLSSLFCINTEIKPIQHSVFI